MTATIFESEIGGLLILPGEEQEVRGAFRKQLPYVLCFKRRNTVALNFESVRLERKLYSLKRRRRYGLSECGASNEVSLCLRMQPSTLISQGHYMMCCLPSCAHLADAAACDRRLSPFSLWFRLAMVSQLRVKRIFGKESASALNLGVLADRRSRSSKLSRGERGVGDNPSVRRARELHLNNAMRIAEELS